MSTSRKGLPQKSILRAETEDRPAPDDPGVVSGDGCSPDSWRESSYSANVGTDKGIEKAAGNEPLTRNTAAPVDCTPGRTAAKPHVRRRQWRNVIALMART
jgi:hypothetical protein